MVCPRRIRACKPCREGMLVIWCIYIYNIKSLQKTMATLNFLTSHRKVDSCNLSREKQNRCLNCWNALTVFKESPLSHHKQQLMDYNNVFFYTRFNFVKEFKFLTQALTFLCPGLALRHLYDVKKWRHKHVTMQLVINKSKLCFTTRARFLLKQSEENGFFVFIKWS